MPWFKRKSSGSAALIDEGFRFRDDGQHADLIAVLAAFRIRTEQLCHACIERSRADARRWSIDMARQTTVFRLREAAEELQRASAHLDAAQAKWEEAAEVLMRSYPQTWKWFDGNAKRDIARASGTDWIGAYAKLLDDGGQGGA